MTSARAARHQASAKTLVLERFLRYRLSELSNRVSRAIAARCAQAFHLTIPEWRVIAVLGRAAGGNARDIANEMDKVAVSRALSRLTAAGRVRAEPDAADRRGARLTNCRRPPNRCSGWARLLPA